MIENRDKGDFIYEHMYDLSLIHIRFRFDINKSIIINYSRFTERGAIKRRVWFNRMGTKLGWSSTYYYEFV